MIHSNNKKSLIHENSQISNITDLQGYLKNINDWNEIIAKKLAKSEGINLKPVHWEIIRFVRTFYKEYEMLPKIRTIINFIALKHGSKTGNSRYLVQLFPKKSAIQQIAKISGLPKPNTCI